jgi:hypothetical protein
MMDRQNHKRKNNLPPNRAGGPARRAGATPISLLTIALKLIGLVQYVEHHKAVVRN